MGYDKKKALVSYINKVIEDACKAENRPNDVKYFAYVIDGDNLFVEVKSQYLRVVRRIYYRLNRNIPKNFKMKLVDMWHKYYWELNDKPDISIGDSRIEAGYTVGHFKENGKNYFVSLTAIGSKADKLEHGLNADTVEGVWAACDKLREQMESVGGHQFYYDNLDTAYETYVSDYEKVFGKKPLALTIEKIA